MDIQEYKKILQAVPGTGIFIIREDNHEILYLNERVREVSPKAREGMPCHEMGGHSCANCPLLSMGDRQESKSVCYNSPFGEIVDVVVLRIKWEDRIPAFMIAISPHRQTITNAYHKVLRVNLTQDRYEVVRMPARDLEFANGKDNFSTWLGHIIYNGSIHPEDMNNFIAFTRPEHLLEALDGGQEILTCCYRRRIDNDFRWNLMEVVPDPVCGNDDRFVFLYIKDVHEMFLRSLKLDDANIRIQEVVRMLGEQNFGIYWIDLDTGETNLVRENGRTHTSWKSWTVHWDEIISSRLAMQIHPANKEKFCRDFSLEGLCRHKETAVQKADMLCQWRGEEDHEYRYMAVIAYFGQNHSTENYAILALQNVDKRVRQEHTLTLRDMQLAAILKSRYSVMTTVYLENGQCERMWISEESRMQKAVSENYHQYFHKMLETEVDPEDQDAFQKVMNPEHLYQMAANTRDYAEEICRYRIAGKVLQWFEQHVIYIRQRGQMSVQILGRDITREKLEEERRLKGEQEQADIVRSLGGMFFATYYADLEQDVFRSVTQLKEVGKALEGRVDYETGLKAYAENFVHPEDRAEYLRLLSAENLRRTLSAKNPYVTLAYRKPPREQDTRPEDYGWIRSTAVMSQTDADGRARSIVYAAQDVTESKRKEMREQQALQAACEAADHANASKQEFISRMSHNVRTPMNGILGMIQIAADHAGEPDKVRECLEKASASGMHLLSMLNEILDISQIQSGGFDLKEEPFGLSELIGEMTAAILPDVRKKEQLLRVHPLAVEHGKVLGDRNRLLQIFLSILGNSIKYTPPNGVMEVRVLERESHENGCSSYDFIFGDNGIGMDKEFVGHIFEPFAREKGPNMDLAEGMGLGLTIARNIARMMGGSISVKSAPGRGSEFTVTVILRLQNPVESDSVSDTGPEETAEYSFQGSRILLVEDNELNREIAMELIGELGAQVECAGDGRKGLQRFVEMPEGYYDLILMDIQMPVMNGFEATRAIRKIPRADAAKIPILALSANASSEDIAAGREAGMDGHIAKPLHIPQLMEQMERWLKER